MQSITNSPPNKRLGRYELITRLAVGGMAELFLAEQVGAEGFRKRVVVKRLLPHLARRRDVVNMLLNEARLASHIDHPNVVQILDLGQEGDDFYIAMEYLDGRSLADIDEVAHTDGRNIPMELAARIVADACAGLEVAHNAVDPKGRPLGLIHRDFTPANVFVTFDGRVKLLDFGIAKSAILPSHTQPGALKGKYAFMSPEMVAGQPLDRRADLFAAGVMLYQVTTGRMPFMADSVQALLAAIAEARPVAPRSLDPAIPEAIEKLTLRLLQANPADRPQTAAEVKDTLERWLVSAGQVVGAAQLAPYLGALFPRHDAELAASTATTAPSGPETLVHTRRRSRRTPAVLATIAVALAGGAAVALWPSPRAVPPRAAEPEVTPEAQTMLVQGQQALEAGGFDEAFRTAQRLIRENPQNGQAHLLLGKTLYAQRSTKGAEDELLAAAKLMPKNPEPLRVLDRLKTQEAALPGAIAAIENAHGGAVASGDPTPAALPAAPHAKAAPPAGDAGVPTTVEIGGLQIPIAADSDTLGHRPVEGAVSDAPPEPERHKPPSNDYAEFLERHKADLSSCASWSADGAAVKGWLSVEWVVKADGSPAHFKVLQENLDAPLVERCMLREMAGWHFEPPPPAETTVRHNFYLMLAAQPEMAPGSTP